MQPGHLDDTSERPSGFTISACQAPRKMLARVGDEWSVLIVMLLIGGPIGFTALRRALDGISQRMLALTLRGLKRDGLVSRTIFAGVPLRIDDALTPLGRALAVPMRALGASAASKQEAVRAPRAGFDKPDTA